MLDFRQHRLDNGLTIVGEIDPAAYTAAIGFFVKTGARDEDREVMGVSHFLEHMMFKGTETRTAADVDRDFDDIGANHNAFTTSEMTAFWCHCLPEHLPRGEAVLADILRPALREADFKNEKHVILEEIAMYEDQPFWVLYERAQEVFYHAHPLGHRVLGTAETVGGLRREQMSAYFRRRYSADNTVVSVAGRIDFDALVERLGAACGSWQATAPQRTQPETAPPDERFTIVSSKATRHYELMLAPAPGLNDERRYAAAMLMQILGAGDGSRLYWALIETGFAEEALAEFDGRDGTGQFLVYFSCSPDQADHVEQIAGEQIAGLLASLTEDDLGRVRSRAATAATLHGELPAGRMQRLGRLWTYTGAYRSLDSEIQRINAVTLEELRQVAEDFPLAPRVVGRLEPE